MESEGFDIMRLYSNERKPYTEKRGIVEKSRVPLPSKIDVSLHITLDGELFSFSHDKWVPTILAGQEVILSLDDKIENKIVGIQVISGDKCLFQVWLKDLSHWE